MAPMPIFQVVLQFSKTRICWGERLSLAANQQEAPPERRVKQTTVKKISWKAGVILKLLAMARRSLQASSQGIQILKKSFRKKKGGQTYVAGAVGCSRQTIWSLLQGNPIDCDVFMEVCKELGLNWEEIAESELPEPEQNDSQDIDALVREVRERIQPYIQERCGTMRVLDMTQPVALGDIYTSVNILEKLTRYRELKPGGLMRDTSPEKFERFCLGDVREKGVPGLEAVEKFSKLMILGKPGAGKTTFLKHLAIQSIGSKFQGDRVPVFITLKDFAEADGKPDLLEYITRLVAMFSIREQRLAPLQPNIAVMQEILNQGGALILLDGLDEVRDADSNQLLRQIREFSQQFPQNQFVITCRIAAREYTFEQFTEVEIADFNDEQIADFSGKWFRSKNDPIKAERFLERLKEDEPIQELATSPLLLTLLCLAFEDSGSFPTNRAELYENGVDVLLKKWDVKRNIERDQVYKRLSLKRKEDLLSQIARTTFEAGNYFFKQREVERLITQYIQNLPDASTDPEALELDSASVLKSIEAQHGLFVERARSIYSFSHLTFHEYFTARKIVTSCNPHAADDPMLQGLVSHLTEKRWREVFLLTVGMLDSADVLLGLMKYQIDLLLAGDEKLQLFLDWVNQKSLSIEFSPQAGRIRAFYTSFSLIINRNFKHYSLEFTLAQALSPNKKFNLCSKLILDYAFLEIFIDAILLTFGGASSSRINIFDVFDITSSNSVAINLNLILTQILSYNLEKEFQQALEKLKDKVPKLPEIDENLRIRLKNQEFFEEFLKDLHDWWKNNGKSWIERLRYVMIEYRNLGHDWQFSEAQKERLQQYYDANKLLVDCLNSDCYVSREVRQEIEETLLLPIAEIETRKRMKDEG
jgi:predicted NACHT family NTPase